MVIVDNNILSSLAKVNQLELLEECFKHIQTIVELVPF